ncbi:hypothetical protein Pelo_4667 [Pelomyxa schiedti]|nr:hypothetical protein Pelo_4667 [Pelomyxa schiedti]
MADNQPQPPPPPPPAMGGGPGGRGRGGGRGGRGGAEGAGKRRAWADPTAALGGGACDQTGVPPLPPAVVAAEPREGLDDVDAFWSAVASVRKSQAGSGGVWFVQLTPPGLQTGIVVLKTSNSIASDWFCLELGKILGAPMPVMRILKPESAEVFAATYACLERLAIQTHGAIPQQARGPRNLNTLLQLSLCVPGAGSFAKPYAQLMEFLPCMTGDLMLDSAMSAEPNPTSPATKCTNTQEALQRIGRLLALDVLTNNSDRLPVGQLWKYMEGVEANLQNIAFSLSDCMPYGLDQALNCISPTRSHQRYEEYLQETQKIVHAAREACSTDSIPSYRPFQTAASLLQKMLVLTPGETAPLEKYIAIGFCAALDEAKHKISSRSVLEEIRQKVCTPFERVVEMFMLTNESVGLNRVNTDFLWELLSVTLH